MNSRTKKLILAAMIAPAVLIALVAWEALHVRTQVKDLFRLNRQLQEEGYYVGDFEFKMLGLAYWLDKGEYVKALTMIGTLHSKMETRTGFARIPEFQTKAEELDFYLDLQDPGTGAFMDPDFPYCTYNEVTENVIAHLSALAEELGVPLKLKYPLVYLDEVDTPDELTAFLDDVSHVGPIATLFPQTSFLFARSMLSHSGDEGVIEGRQLHAFSPEWQRSLLQWFYDHQDAETGFWGPISRSNGEMLTVDLNNTASIIKHFVKADGTDIHKDFPLRYRNEMFARALDVLALPMPGGADLDQIHECNLTMAKGIPMLTRYLWPGASRAHRLQARKLFAQYVARIFERNYVPEDGAFSYYPDEHHATLDGLGYFFLFEELGAFSVERQTELWADLDDPLTDHGVIAVSSLDATALEGLVTDARVNSIRVYAENPTASYVEAVEFVIYPRETPVLDIVDLTAMVSSWLESTSMTMGNWTSRAVAQADIKELETSDAKIFSGIPINDLNAMLARSGQFVTLCFDSLQMPVC
ncbi:hypothetical protein LHP98_18890 [Rhodobacter sp. Har01]|uniref:hypothetical protein n=1 Tax=Rhodobacter sp. Har01 TaxID=2883999 RepID=UPI001D070001|nr:hypothetical protein [Rhodobacter sp. Har01]MCB6180186.1 hypothetical protein [Rhodobacter sp. Har01]